MLERRRLLVCDLDNTLYDWVAYFVASFYSMVDVVVELTGCDRERLLNDFREVHQRHQDAEHPFALLETRTVRELFPRASSAEIASALDPAFHAFNSARKKSLELYPGVREGLDSLLASDFILVAHTESKLYGAMDRLSRLDLHRYFTKIYCRERSSSAHPQRDAARKLISQFPMEKIVELSHHQRKPNPTVLREICETEGVRPERSAYVGDSLARDVMMAREAGVYAIWAKYGSSGQRDIYERLVRVTHWSEEDVIRERELTIRSKAIQPDFTLYRGFLEILKPLEVSV